jgi:glycosyltransferase involved in cell wall biosynthesis
VQLGAILKRRGLPFELRLIGEVQSDFRKTLGHAIEELGVGDRIVLSGRLPFEQTQKEISAGGIGLHLTKKTPNAVNSLPIKILEYMAHGLAVVATDIECWRQWVVGVGAGALVDPTRLEEAADAVEGMLRHPEAMHRMGAAGRRAVLQNFNWEAESRILLSFYSRLLTGSRKH